MFSQEHDFFVTLVLYRGLFQSKKQKQFWFVLHEEHLAFITYEDRRQQKTVIPHSYPGKH